jgi:hypothetical protein
MTTVGVHWWRDLPVNVGMDSTGQVWYQGPVPTASDQLTADQHPS